MILRLDRLGRRTDHTRIHPDQIGAAHPRSPGASSGHDYHICALDRIQRLATRHIGRRPRDPCRMHQIQRRRLGNARRNINQRNFRSHVRIRGQMGNIATDTTCADQRQFFQLTLLRA